MTVVETGRAMATRVSIVIINWNGLQYLERCLDSAMAQDYPDVEIIVMDNGSTDGSVVFVRDRYPRVIIVASSRNVGTAEGNNMAARRATGDYLFLMNSDAWLVHAHTISTLVESANRYPSAAIIGCQVLNVDGSIQDIGEKIDAYGFPGGIALCPGPLPDIIDDLFFVTSCAMLIRSKVFRAVGGYDSRYFWSHEEVDLAWQVRLRGYTVLTDTRAIAVHVGGGSMVGGAPGKGPRYRTTTARIYHRERSGLATLIKNYSASSLLRVLPVYVVLSSAEVVLFAIMRRPIVAYQILRAYWWNICHLRGTLRARRRIQSERSISDRDVARYFWPHSKKLEYIMSQGLPRIDHVASGARWDVKE